MQGHLFQLLRPLVSAHTDIRDALAKTRAGDMDGYESVLALVERAVRKGIDEHAASSSGQADSGTPQKQDNISETSEAEVAMTPKQKTEQIYKRPWWVCQPHIRPLPEEAMASGALKVKKKDLARIQMTEKSWRYRTNRSGERTTL